MSKSTSSGSDLFSYAGRGNSRPVTRAKWKPARRNGFAAALAVIVEQGRRGALSNAKRALRLVTPEPEQESLLVARPHWTEIEPALLPVVEPVVATEVMPVAPIAITNEPVCGTLFAELADEPTARCPKCGVHGEVKALFGTRMVDGKRRPQSWCRQCRRAKKHADAPAMIREAERFGREAEAVGGGKEDELPLGALRL